MSLTLFLSSVLSVAAPTGVSMTPKTITLDTVAVVTTPGTARPAASAKTRYCIFETATGSRIRTKTCHTADEWIASEGEIPTGRISRR